MSDTVSVLWTIIAQHEPQPILNCSRCGGVRPFHSSGLFRLNANGKRLDAWLIYRCRSCDNAWNRAIFERQPVSAIDPGLLASLHANDVALARRIAFDVEGLKQYGARLEAPLAPRPSKRLLSGDATTALRLEIRIEIAMPVDLRLDRLLAAELGLSRSQLQRMDENGEIMMRPSTRRRLRGPASDDMRIAIDLSSWNERQEVVLAAAGPPADPASPHGLIGACSP